MVALLSGVSNNWILRYPLKWPVNKEKNNSKQLSDLSQKFDFGKKMRCGISCESVFEQYKACECVCDRAY